MKVHDKVVVRYAGSDGRYDGKVGTLIAPSAPYPEQAAIGIKLCWIVSFDDPGDLHPHNADGTFRFAEDILCGASGDGGSGS